jgi:hypothetical protein
MNGQIRPDSVSSDNSESVRSPRILVVSGIRGTGHTFPSNLSVSSDLFLQSRSGDETVARLIGDLNLLKPSWAAALIR